MQIILFDDAKQNLETIGEPVCQDHEPDVVKRNNDQNVVILSLEDYNAWVETSYLLSNPHNATRLLTSLLMLGTQLPSFPRVLSSTMDSV